MARSTHQRSAGRTRKRRAITSKLFSPRFEQLELKSRRPQFENLEQRALLAIDAFSAIDPSGSLVHASFEASDFATTAETDNFTIDLDPDQNATVVFTPTDPSIQCRVELLDPSASVLATADAAAAGDSVVLQTTPLDAVGTYTIALTSLAGSGDYNVSLVLNAAVEEETYGAASNDSTASAEDIESGHITLGSDRLAVLGQTEGGSDYYSFDLDAGQTASLTVRSLTTGGEIGLELYNSAGRVALGSSDGDYRDYDGAEIHHFVSPAADTYYMAINSPDSGVDYSALVMRDISYEQEPNGQLDDAQDISLTGQVLGGLREGTSGGGATIRVAIPAGGYSAKVRDQLNDSTSFDFVAEVVPFSGLDTVEELRNYDVLVTGNPYDTFDSTAAAAIRAANASGELGVVATSWQFYNVLNYSGASKANLDAVIPLDMNGSRSSISSVRILDSTHPVTEGLPTSISLSGGERSSTGADSGSEILGDDGSGNPTVIVSEETGDRAVWLAPAYFFDYSTNTNGSAQDQLLEQGVNWAAGGGSDRSDYFSYLANPDDTLIFSTATPFDGPGAVPNDLDPLLELFDPSGTLIASNNNDPSGDGHNALIEYTVPTDAGGLYRARISAVSGAGDYTLTATGSTATPGSPLLEVTSTSITDGETLTAFPNTVRFDFNAPINLSTLDAADLMVNSLPADSVTVVDADTLEFDITGTFTGDMQYDLLIDADIMTNLQGTGNAAFSVSFDLDTTSPVITATNVAQGELIEPGNHTFTATFSEPIDESVIGLEDFSLQEHTFDATFTPVGFSYDPSTNTGSVDFEGLYDGNYTLILYSGPEGFKDLNGHQLNGWPSDPLPSGQGDPAADSFILDFIVDSSAGDAYPVPLAAKAPMGSLIYDPSVKGLIYDSSDADDYTVTLDEAQTVTLIVETTAPGSDLQARIELFAPGGALLGSADAAGPRQPVVLQTAEAAVAGEYTMRVSGVDSTTGGYTARLILNAAVEEEQYGGASNDDLASAQDLEPSSILLRADADRMAVMGEVMGEVMNFDVVDVGYTAENRMNGNIRGMTSIGGGAVIMSTGGSLYIVDQFGEITTGILGSELEVFVHGLVLDYESPIPSLYTVAGWSDQVSQLDIISGAVVDSVTITMPGYTVRGANALAIDPTTGIYWAALNVDEISGRVLAMLDPITGEAIFVGEMGDWISALTFNNDGELFGLIGDGGQNPNTLIRLNKTDATWTPLHTFEPDGSGEALAFDPDLDAFFRASGVGQAFQMFTLSTEDDVILTDIGLDVMGDHVRGMTYGGDNRFLMTDGAGLFNMTTAGEVTRTGTLSEMTHALTEIAGDWYAAGGQSNILRRIDPVTGADLDSTTVSIPNADVYSVHGLATDPSGQMWGVVQASNVSSRGLVTIDPITGEASLVGDLGLYVSAIAFDDSGNLYGVTGSDYNHPETLFQINTTSAATTLIIPLSAADSGEALAFNPVDGSLWRASGSDVLQKITLGQVGGQSDVYSCQFSTGQPLSAVAVGNVTLRLFDENGILLAESDDPGASVDQGIMNYIPTSDGTCYIEVTSSRENTQYSLVVTRNATFETEPQDAPQDISDSYTSGLVLGHVGGTVSIGGSGPVVSLSTNLYDAGGYMWDIQQNGYISNGSNDAYDGGMQLNGFPGFSTAATEEDGREIVIGPATIGDIEVARKIYVPADQSYARFLEIVTNTGTTTANYTVQIDTNLGSDSSTTPLGTSSGDTAFTPDDDWIVTDDTSSGGGDPAVTHVISGPGGRLSAATTQHYSYDDIRYTYDLTLEPGETQIIMHFAAQDYNRDDALAMAPELAALQLDTLEGMDYIERALVMNFNTGSSVQGEFTIEVNEGDVLELTTTTPGGGSGEPVNELDPLIELYDASGSLLESNDNWTVEDGGDDRNARITYTVPSDGAGQRTYTILVKAADDEGGEYTLLVDGATGSRSFDVIASVPYDTELLPSYLNSYQVDLSESFLLTSVDAGDLLIEGLPADAVTVVDHNTLEFDITSHADGDGAYTITIDAGALTSLTGKPLQAFTSTFYVDSVAPTVANSSITEGQVIPTGPLVYEATFSENMATDDIGSEDVVLFNTDTSETYTPETFNLSGDTLNVTYGHLPEGSYSLTLLSGVDAFRDVPNTPLDGNADTVPGDDFILNFQVDVDVIPFPVPLSPVLPYGSLIHEGTTAGRFHAGDSDTFTVELDENQTATIVFRPADSSIQGSIELLDPSGNPVGSASAAAAAETAVLQTAALSTAGTYSINIGALAGEGTYEVDLILNAALENEMLGGASNNTPATAEDLNAASIALDSDRLAIMGFTETGTPDCYAFDLTAGQYATLAVIGLGNTSVDLQLYDDVGTLLALGSAEASNVDEHISLFQAPADGTYIAQITGSNTTVYSLVVTRDADFDIEPNGDQESASQSLSAVDTVLGHVGGGSGGDSSIDVALLAADTDTYISDVEAKLNGLGVFDSITTIKVNSTTPSVETLQAFDSVLVWSDYTFANATQLGNNLADYVDGGGGVVVQTFATSSSTYSVGGRWLSDGYNPITVGSYTSGGSLTLGAVADPDHPIMEGVDSFSGGSSSYRGTGSLTTDATLIASWSNGSPLVADLMTFEGPIVLLNFFPPSNTVSSGFWQSSTDGDLLMGNALLHAAGATDHADVYSFWMEAGDTISLETSLPAVGTGEFVNSLDPGFELLRPDGTPVAHTNVAGNEQLTYTAAETGLHTLEVFGETDEVGTYVLSATGPRGDISPLVVTATDPVDGELLSAYPTSYRVDLSAPLLLTSVDAEDLTVSLSGAPVAADSVTVIDADTLEFDITSAGVGDGIYTVQIAAGALTSVSGTPLEAFTATFDYDGTSPFVITSSITEGDSLAPGNLVYEVQFSEEMATSDLGAEDVTLVESFSGDSISADAFNYDPSTSIATVEYNNLPEGNYTLTLLTSTNAFRDRRDNLLDGTPSSPLPSGDGTPGDDYVLNFKVDVTEESLFPPEPVAPLGSLIYDPPVGDIFNEIGDTDTRTIIVEGGDTLTVVLVPQDTSIVGQIEVTDSSGSVLGLATSSAAGAPVVLQTVAIPVTDTYSIKVTSTAGTGAYTVESILNAAVEDEEWGGASNNDINTAQDLTASFIAVGSAGSRGAVLGSAVEDDVDVYAMELTAGQPATVAFTGVGGGQLALMDNSGATLALGVSGWNNVDQVVHNFVAPTDGTYYLQVEDFSDYSGLITLDCDFSLETYFNDFESGAGAEWSTGVTDSSVHTFTTFLGRFSGGQGATLTLPTVPGVSYTAEFDLMIIDSWDGDSYYYGPDSFNVSVDGTQLFHHTFTTGGTNQSYPFGPDMAGFNYGWGGWNDAVYRGVSVPFVATDTTTTIRFYDGGLQGLGDESWGIDNISVRPSSAGGVEQGTQDISLSGSVLGHNQGHGEDYQFAAISGNQLLIYTTTPGSEPGQPDNNFDPRIELYNHAGNLIAVDDNNGPQEDGVNAGIEYTVQADGQYVVRVLGTDTGEYTLNIIGASGASLSPPQVVSTDPVEAQKLSGPPTSIDLIFSEGIRVDSVATTDLSIDAGATVDGVEMLGGRTVRFHVTVPDVNDTYTYTLSAGSIVDLQGELNPEYQGTFLVDKSGPKVLEHHPALQASAPFTEMTFIFDEDIAPLSFTASDVAQFSGPGGVNLLTQITGVNVSGNEATVVFNDQSAQGTYVMTIGPNITDLVSNKMDQDENGVNGESHDYYIAAVDLQSADLVVDLVDLPTSATFGAPMNLSWTVRNTGTDPAIEGWKDQAWLSTDNVFSSDDIQLMTDAMSPPTGTVPLASGTPYTQSTTVNLPLNSTLSDGVYYILVKTDSQNEQAENNENNNFNFESISITLPPLTDLVVSEIDAPIEGLSGTAIQYSWTVTNQGDADASGTWYDRVYLSTDTTLGGDIYLGDFTFTGTIRANESITRIQTYTLPVNMEGDRWFIIQTDHGNSVYEHAQENNNTTVSAEPMEVELAPFPNLQVDAVIPPSESYSSQQAVVEWTVINNGTGSTSAPIWRDQVWLSDDDVLDGGDRYMGQVDNPSYLAPGDSYTSSLTVNMPQGIQGDYYFIVKTDAYNHVYEHNDEDDNVTTSPEFHVTLTPPPDLQVATISAPDIAFSNQAVPVSWTVINDDLTPGAGGTTLQTQWRDQVWLSDTPDLASGTNYNMGNIWHTGALGPGESYTATLNARIPVSIEGEWYFIVVTDSQNHVFEHVFENNNVNVRRNDSEEPNPTNITLTPPDLEVDFVDAPSDAESGHSMSFDYMVTNWGVAETPNSSWGDDYWLSTDQTLDTDTDIHLGTRTHYGSLQPSYSYTRNVSYSLPNGLTGDYYVLVRTDSNNAVFEGDPGEDNNVTSSPDPVHIVSNPPDLVISPDSFESWSAGMAGSFVRATWGVANQGSGSTVGGTWRCKVYASMDNYRGGPDDRLLSTFTWNGGDLGPGESYTAVDKQIDIPLDMSGTIYLWVITDADNQVYEGANEDNNYSELIPVEITQNLSDLRVINIPEITGNVQAGQSVPITWTVLNDGTSRTNALSWRDRIYLSPDTDLGDGNDIAVGSYRRNSPLDVDESYTATTTITIPANISGPFYIGVYTDADNNVYEGLEDNNWMSRGTTGDPIDPSDPNPANPPDPVDVDPPEPGTILVPDLVLAAADAPAEAYSGQAFNMTWTVSNDGDPETRNWYDQVYLSLDQVYDPGSDISLGHRWHYGGLAAGGEAGDSYTASASFNIPRGLSGPFYVFVVTDRGSYVSEANEFNNVDYDRTSMLVNLLPPADLVLGTITVPSNASPGISATITYTVENLGDDAALGSWYDSLYISADDTWDIGDAFFGRKRHVAPSGGVPGLGGSYTESLTAALPGVVPGDYHVIVRSDIRNHIPESDETNNIGASLDTTIVDAQLLQMSVPENGTLTQARAVYYKTEVIAAGETVRLSFDGAEDLYSEVYVRYEAMPSRTQFDFAAIQPFVSDHELVLPVEQTGTYYVMAYGTVAPAARDYEILAEIIPFSIQSVYADTVGNSGKATVKISGARFDENTTFDLVDEQFNTLAAEKVYIQDSATAFVTFNLLGTEPGTYTVGATDQANATSVTLTDGLTVVEGHGFDVEITGQGPAVVRPDRNYRFDIYYGNEGDGDAMAPLLIAEASTDTQMGFSRGQMYTGSALHVLGSPDEGPLDVLRPGALNSVPIHYNSGAAVDIQIFAVTHDDPTRITTEEWEAIKLSVKPESVSQSDWNAFWANIPARIGTVWGDYVTFLNRLATEQALPGDPIHDVRAMFEALYNSNPSYLPTMTVGGSLLDADTESGLSGIQLAAFRFTDNGSAVSEGYAVTDENGEFTLNYLPEGDYQLMIGANENGEFMSWDLDQDGEADLYEPLFTLDQTAGDLSGLQYHARITPDIQTDRDTTPQLLNDPDGVSHLFWKRDGVLMHSYHDGSDWVAAGPVTVGDGENGLPAPLVDCYDFSVAASDKLVDNGDGSRSAGIMLVWTANEGRANGMETYYSIGQTQSGGQYQWSQPIQLTEDDINDLAPVAAVDETGQVVLVYQKVDERKEDDAGDAFNDDTDLYYNDMSIQSGDLVFPTGLSVDELLGDELYAAGTHSISVGWQWEATPKWSFLKKLADLKVKVFAEGSYSKDCTVSLGLKGGGQLSFTSALGTPQSLSGDFSYSGSWKAFGTRTDCHYKFASANATVTIGGAFKPLTIPAERFTSYLPPQFGLPATLTLAILRKAKVLEIDCGIAVGGSISGTIVWNQSDAPPVQYRMPDTGSIGVDVWIGPWVSAVSKSFGAEIELSGKVGATADVYPDPKVKTLYGKLALDVVLPWPFSGFTGTYEYNPSWDVSSMGMTEQDGSLIVGASLPPGVTASLSYDPTRLMGTSTDYSGLNAGELSVLNNVDSDFLDDGPAAIATGPNGEIIIAWSKTIQDGDILRNAIYTSVYNTADNKWATPVELPGSMGSAVDPDIIFDADGNPLVVWSMADISDIDPSTWDPNDPNYQEILSDAIIRGMTEADIYYSVYDSGLETWSTATQVAMDAGGDYRPALAATSNEVMLTWTNVGDLVGEEFQDDHLMVSSWDGSTWSIAQTLATGEMVDPVTMDQVSGITTAFWTQDVNPDPLDTQTSIFFSTFDTGLGVWALPVEFEPIFAAADVGTAGSATPIGAQGVGHYFDPPPDNCCKCTKIDTEYRGTDEGCGFTTTYDHDKCKKIITYKPCVRRPVDPNDILGPEGYGDEHWIEADRIIDYTIRYENDPVFAEASAQKVVITQTLDEDLDWRTFRVGNFGFGDMVFEVPENRAFYSERLDLTAEHGFFVDFAAGIDVSTGEAFWSLTTIDPATGEQPLDPDAGFLPVNDENGAGEGYVTYSVRPKRTAETGDIVDALARIVFDTNEPIDTPPIFNTLDAVAPNSEVTEAVAISPESTAVRLEAETVYTDVTDPNFTVSWQASDDEGGSGLAVFNVFVSVDGDDYELWLAATTWTEAVYEGEAGHTYAFYTQAYDNAGNEEEAPEEPDLVVTVAGTKGITVTPVDGLVTTEAGDTATFTVVLDGIPDADVIVTIASSNEDEGTVDLTSLTFTTENWSEPQTITVTGAGDDVDDGDQSYSVLVGPFTSDDATYAAIDPLQVLLTNEDDDTAGITVEPTSALVTSEDGQTAAFTVVLDSEPTADVTIDVSSDNDAEGMASHTTLTFTADDWDTPQTVTVTGENDDIDDDDVNYNVLLGPVTSDDELYAAINPDDVSLTNQDNDTAGVTVSPTSGLITSENGTTAIFTVVLDSEPTAEVIIDVSSDNENEGKISHASLTFSVDDWDSPQTVTITGQNDDADDGNINYNILLGPVTSDDSLYAAIDPDDVAVINQDNDAAGITVNPTSGLETSEWGGTATFTVALNAQPSHAVTIDLSSDDTSEGTVSDSSFLFTTENWQTPQTVTVTGVEDDVDDGDMSYNIELGPVTSDDANYAAIDPDDVSLTNADDDTAGIIITPISGLTTSEDGGQATFTVSLTSRPIAPITIEIASDDDSEGTVDATILTFSNEGTAWEDVKTVTITGINDDTDDGDVDITITVGPVAGDDPLYAAIDPDDVSVTNVDNDTAAIIVTPISGLTTSEDGGQATFSVSLASRPTAPITIQIASDNELEGTVDPLTLTFSDQGSAWEDVKIVTITGANDDDVDGDTNYTITVGPVASDDPLYAAIDPDDVSVMNIDNDEAGDTTPPQVTDFIVQDDLSQRSFVDMLEIIFSEDVNAAQLIAASDIASAVQLTNLGVDADADADDAVTLSGSQFQWDAGNLKLTWSFDSFAGGTTSLPNGYYELRLDGDLITDAAGNRLGGGVGYTAYFHVLAGDVTGDMLVDSVDSNFIYAHFGGVPGMPNWNANADTDRDNWISIDDYITVHFALGSEIIPPADIGGDQTDPVERALVATSDQLTRTWTDTYLASLDSPIDSDWIHFLAPASGTLSASATLLSGTGQQPRVAIFERIDTDSELAIETQTLASATTTAVAGREYIVMVDAIPGTDLSGSGYRLEVELAEFDDYLILTGMDKVLADYEYRGTGYSVAVIDTGIDYTHPDLVGRVILGPDFADADNDPMDTVGHGTHVAGIIASANDHAPGIAPDANVIALKITEDGLLSSSIPMIEQALTWVADHRLEYNIAAVNISFGGGNVPKGTAIETIEPLYRGLAEDGVFIAVSSGNAYSTSDSQGLNVLAASHAVAAVGATWDSDVGSIAFTNGATDYSTGADRITSFTQRSADLDLVAPGGDILNLDLGGGLSVRHGTSMSAPLAAGAALLLRQTADAAGASPSSAQILDVMETTAERVFDGDDEDDNVFNTNRNYARLDIAAAMDSMVANPVAYQPGSYINSPSDLWIRSLDVAAQSDITLASGPDFDSATVGLMWPNNQTYRPFSINGARDGYFARYDQKDEIHPLILGRKETTDTQIDPEATLVSTIENDWREAVDRIFESSPIMDGIFDLDILFDEPNDGDKEEPLPKNKHELEKWWTV